MANEQAKQLLQQGIAAAKAGQPAEARQLLQQAVKRDPTNESAWLWLSSVAKDDQERIFCLKKILEINPNNENAIKGLRQVGGGPEPRRDPTPSGIRKLNTPLPKRDTGEQPAAPTPAPAPEQARKSQVMQAPQQ